MIIYSKSNNFNNAAIGKMENPIKMVIEHESDLITKKGGICDALFNVEKSNRFGESIVTHNEFDVFQATAEGATAAQDTVLQSYDKFIEHIQFTKEFVISAEMMEDANFGIAADAKHRIENFVRAYYKTINKICEHALINGTLTETTFAGAELDLTTMDDEPLFTRYHCWGSPNATLGGEQCNYFYGDIFCSGNSQDRVYSTEIFEEKLYALASKLRNMRDENGEPMGYTADTIIIPSNYPKLEQVVKKVCGSEGALGNGYNDINLHYGNWNVIVLPSWEPEKPSMMLMSSEANKNLCGNMFFNRVPLTVTNWVDNHTGNYIWNGRCRFGVGFGSYKHILLAVDTIEEIETAAKITV